MNKDNKQRIVFVSICVVLGIILSVQFKTATYTTGEGITPRDREKQLSLEYQKVLEQKEALQDGLGKIEDEIRSYEEFEKENDTHIKELYDELEKYKMFVGLEPVTGTGVTIEINEPSLQMEKGEEYSIVTANYDLILQLFSKLNDLGAEAISINEERYTNYTSLDVKDNSMKINGVSITPPFEIKVIGDSEELMRGLDVKRNIMWNMKNKYLYNIKIEKKSNLVIPKYNKIPKTLYAKPVNK